MDCPKSFSPSNDIDDHRKPASKTILGIRSTIWWLCLVIFLGFLVLWIMMPTNTYRLTWLPTLKAKANSSTTFGTLEGTNILVFTFPIMLIAVLGCLYLHLGSKYNDDNRVESSKKRNADDNHRSYWKRTVLVKGPLGIVSMTELAFFFMFIVLLAWSLTFYLYRSYTEMASPQMAPRHGLGGQVVDRIVKKAGEQVWEVRLKYAGLRLGLVGNIGLVFLFFPVTRGSSVLPLLGLTSEASIKYHIWIGHIVMVLFTGHGLCYIIYWAATNKISEMLEWPKIGISNLAGELSLLAGLVLWATSYGSVRRKMFEVFFYTHQLYSLFLIFFMLHIHISYFSTILPGIFLFLIDRYLRFLQSRKRVRVVSARLLPCDTVELNFSKNPGLSYTPTSTLFVNLPGISRLQWHPFTISSNSNLEPERLSVIIKGEGNWSQMLYQILSSSTSIKRLDVSVEGPYGPTSTHFLRHDTLVMVSGGVGITPLFSIIRELIYRSKNSSSKIPRMLLISAFKNSQELTMLDLLLPTSNIPFDISHLRIQIEAYVTREEHPTTENHKQQPRTIWFKPNPSDTPISSILGSNSWLCLGAIISSSFVIFLILLGVITHYYIYPIDHNTNKIYSYPLKALIKMALICISIAVASSSIVLWNKKQNTVNVDQIQNTDTITPTTSPDHKLESLPYQSLAEATKVHFGARPDLKKMLCECQGSSVGVLVCGPKRLRHEVANICNSGLADNLHFESISFSW